LFLYCSFCKDTDFTAHGFIARASLSKLGLTLRTLLFALPFGTSESAMKSIAQAVVIAAALAAPLAAHAQNNEPLTRAQVRADLISVEQAGYWPSRAAELNYPDTIQAAERKIAAQHAATASETGYGDDVSGASQSGARGDTAVSSYSAPIRLAH
jgi:hypothetical protein